MNTAPPVTPGDLRVVALLRGVNVGGRTIPMAQLRTVVAASGARAVRTVLASGNVLLDVTEDAPLADVRADLETRISEAFGYDAHLALLPLELATALADAVPWPDDDTAHGYVVVSTSPGLLADAAAEAATMTDARAGVPEASPEAWQAPPAGLVRRLADVGLDALLWRCPRGSSLTTPLAKVLARSRFRVATTRNVKTLRRFA